MVPKLIRQIVGAAIAISAAIALLFASIYTAGHISAAIMPTVTWQVIGCICLIPVSAGAISVAGYYAIGRRGRRVVRWLYTDEFESLAQRIRRVLDDRDVASFRAVVVGGVLIIRTNAGTDLIDIASGKQVRELDVPPAAMLILTASLSAPAEPAAAQG